VAPYIIETVRERMEANPLAPCTGREKCYICEKGATRQMCEDVDIFTGHYLGVAHLECAKQLKLNAKVPVVFHNLGGFDSHLLLHSITRDRAEDLRLIPLNDERVLCFSLRFFSFIDSMKFLSDSLENLVALHKSANPFVNMHHEFGAKTPKLLEKGVFPYKWFDSVEKFDHTALPPKGAFFNDLRQAHISQESYDFAQEVWREFDCQRFEDYHDLYLKSDVCLLADVFEFFRSKSLFTHGIDQAHFVSLPSFGWQCLLKSKTERLFLMKDKEMYTYMEKGIRGGFTVANTRLTEAIPGEREIRYYDANSLYVYSMMQPLPVSDYE